MLSYSRSRRVIEFSLLESEVRGDLRAGLIVGGKK